MVLGWFFSLSLPTPTIHIFLVQLLGHTQNQTSHYPLPLPSLPILPLPVTWIVPEVPLYGLLAFILVIFHIIFSI